MTSKISALLRIGSPAILVSVGNASSRSDGSMQSGYKIPNDPRRDVIGASTAEAAAAGGSSYLNKWKAWAYAEPTDPVLSAAFDQFRLDQTGGGWDRVDDMAYRRSGSPGDGSAAIAASLGVKAGAIPAYRMYVRRDAGEVAVVAQLASGATGHPSILHGGVTALLFDEGMGWMTAAYRLKEHGVLGALNDVDFVGATDIRKKSVVTFGFTANLHVNYLRPCIVPRSDGAGKDGTVVVLRARVSKADGRKLYLEADLKSPDGKETFADANCLYVQPRPKTA